MGNVKVADGVFDILFSVVVNNVVVLKKRVHERRIVVQQRNFCVEMIENSKQREIIKIGRSVAWCLKR